ncbi:MAG TPA: hypothetical protein VMX75_00835 [Spirochaetia bacterium]|nr:hypothetical protein [Spirochaetia bacterium]
MDSKRAGLCAIFPPLVLFLLILMVSPLSALDGEDSQQESLYLGTLSQDIRTADYYDLLSWCQTLGLEDTGDRVTLQARLYRYYKVKPEVDSGIKPKKRIIIRSASHSDYFTIEEINEDYITLEGDVVIEFIDDEQKVVHAVKAQHVTINQTQNILSARGDIEYSLKRGTDPPEVFRSQGFSFNMKNWAGVFVEGEGETEREVQEKNWIDFYFSGENISRLENDTVVLDEGSVTSSQDRDNPNWHIRATKIYVMAPGEWAIRDAVLYVGRIPIFYVPYFFKPGDELFFHPALGYRNREGNFIQTTTYLVGRKETKASALSFLRVTEVDDQSTEQYIKGLYLRTKKSTQAKQPGVKTEELKRVLKVLLDYYSRLGVFAGLVSDFSPVWQFKGGLGLSRNIYLNPITGLYTQFIGNNLESQWNKTHFATITLPFRYGIETTLNLGGGDQSLTGRFELFSDPFFPEDFYARAEDIDYASLLLGQTAEENLPITPLPGWGLFPETKENFSWQMHTKLIFPLSSTLVREVSVPKLDLEFYWQSKNVQVQDFPHPYYNIDPARKFFYPSRFVLPNAAAGIRGDILHIPLSPKSDTDQKKKADEPGKGYKLPKAEEEDGKEESGPVWEGAQLKTSSLMEDLTYSAPNMFGHTFTLSYDFQPRFLLENQFDFAGWTVADNVDFQTRFTTLNTSGVHKFILLLALWGDTATFKDEIIIEGEYQGHFNRAEDVLDTEWQSLSQTDYGKSSFDLKNDFLLTYYPLLLYRFFDKSKLHYELGWKYYSYRLDHLDGDVPIYSGNWLEWERNTVDTHEVGSSLIYGPAGIANRLDFTVTLPPLYQAYVGETDFTIGYLNSNVKTAYREFYMSWIYDPLLITETLQIVPWISLQEVVDYDLNDQHLTDAKTVLKLFKLRSEDSYYLLEQELLFEPDNRPLSRSKSTLSLFGFQVYFLAEKLVPLEVNLALGEWTPQGTEKFLVPSELYFGYDSSGVPLYMWRNRVRLETNLNASWLIDLQQYTQSTMNFSLKLTLMIYQFLDLTFSISSHNTKSYRYIPAFAHALNEPWVNPVTDLLKSFNFFNIDDRYESSFNLQSVGLTAIHHLQDWDLSIQYAGEQVLETLPTGKEEYVWSPVFTIMLQWNPIPEIKKEIRRDKDTDRIEIRG